MKADPTDLFIPAELTDTVKRLENWGRWAVERQKRRTAASAEGKYRPRPGNNWSLEDSKEMARRGSTPAIKPFDAMEVDKALATAPPNNFPERERDMLKLFYYVCHGNPNADARRFICRRVRIRQDELYLFLRRSLTIARNRLLRREA